MGVLIPLLLIFLACLVIWRACDGFEIASEYLGRNLSDGVRGGTINAIASSMPELLTTAFALLVLKDAAGFSVGIGTTAGSALFNGMIIPALCILLVVGHKIKGREVREIAVRAKVIWRDGLWLLGSGAILVLALSGSALHWWHGLLLMGLYAAYFAFVLLTMGDQGTATAETEEPEDSRDEDQPRSTGALFFYWASFGPLLDLERFFVKERHREQIAAETWNGWPLLVVATTVIGGACWMLVHACEWLGQGQYELLGMSLHGFGMPAMFVAVIFASMATSVPDTVISVRDARDGDYDDAVANALGSNIFDICFALGLPLFAYTAIYGSIELDRNVAIQSAELRLLLLFLTVAGFFTYLLGRRRTDESGRKVIPMGRGRALILLAIYGVFVLYIVALGVSAPWATGISSQLREITALLPAIG